MKVHSFCLHARVRDEDQALPMRSASNYRARFASIGRWARARGYDRLVLIVFPLDVERCAAREHEVSEAMLALPMIINGQRESQYIAKPDFASGESRCVDRAGRVGACSCVSDRNDESIGRNRIFLRGCVRIFVVRNLRPRRKHSVSHCESKNLRSRISWRRGRVAA